MKNFCLGFMSGLLLIVAIIFLSPSYTDFQPRAEASEVLANVKPVINLMEKNFEQSGMFFDLDRNTNWQMFRHRLMVYFDVDGRGDIVIKTQRGQLLFLHLVKNNDKLEWWCFGAPGKDVPSLCRLNY